MIDNICFEVKKCVRNAFSSKQTVKKLNLWEKMAVDKSACIKAWTARMKVLQVRELNPRHG